MRTYVRARACVRVLCVWASDILCSCSPVVYDENMIDTKQHAIIFRWKHEQMYAMNARSCIVKECANIYIYIMT